MKLYYTGAKNNNQEEQKLAIYSLGGYASISPTPSNISGNLFSDISLLSIDNKSQSVIGIALKNELGEDVEDIGLWFEYPINKQAEFEVAAVTMTRDTSGNYYMETIGNMQQIPLVAIFHKADGVANKVNLGDLEDGKYLGLWIKRIIRSDIKDDFTCDKLNTAFGTEPVIDEDIVIKIDWKVATSGSLSGS